MNIEEPNARFVIYKTYPEKLNNDSQDVNDCVVRFEVHTWEKLSDKFDKELELLVSKYAHE